MAMDSATAVEMETAMGLDTGAAAVAVAVYLRIQLGQDLGLAWKSGQMEMSMVMSTAGPCPPLGQCRGRRPSSRVHCIVHQMGLFVASLSAAGYN